MTLQTNLVHNSFLLKNKIEQSKLAACSSLISKPDRSLRSIWPFSRAVDFLHNQISLCKAPKATKPLDQSHSGHSNVQTRDVTSVLQSDWPAKILVHGSKTV